MITPFQLLFAALMAMFPHSPAVGCLRTNEAQIVVDAQAASSAYGVPAGLLYIVAFRETHVGCDAASGGNWGAPISSTRRHTAGNANSAASALALGYRACRSSWRGAVSHFRCGLCRCPDNRRDFAEYVPWVMIKARQIYTRAAQPVPPGL